MPIAVDEVLEYAHNIIYFGLGTFQLLDLILKAFSSNIRQFGGIFSHLDRNIFEKSCLDFILQFTPYKLNIDRKHLTVEAEIFEIMKNVVSIA